jgi:ATP-dependent helicase/nuclease subunit B
VPNVFTISAGVPFLPTLADALVSGELVGSITDGSLADATIYLPTRRAGRAFATVLARRLGPGAHLLPSIVPLGDAAAEPGRFHAPDLPPAIEPLERRLILTRLIQAWAESVARTREAGDPDSPILIPGSPADAISLAADLEALMDALGTENVGWDALGEIVEVEYSRYFQLTLDFVRIAHERWPEILAARGAMDPARRRNAALDAECARLAAWPPTGPVVAAGSTGSIPSTARLLAAISRLPRGSVVLPGLDVDLDEAAWDAIGQDGADGGVHGHPQYILRHLLREHLQVDRPSVQVLASAEGSAAAAATARRRLLSEVMRPAGTTDAWARMDPVARAALAQTGTGGLALVEAGDEREEALAIAVALRETLAVPGRTAALVTPDRALARRVLAELGRWRIGITDSAGTPLSDTPVGRLARLAADAAASDFHPVQVLALLSHPSVRLGLERTAVEQAAAALEIGVLRGPQPRPGLDGLVAALALRRASTDRREPIPRRRLTTSEWDLAEELVRRLDLAFGHFRRGRLPDRDLDLVRLSILHGETVAALTRPPGRAGADPDRAAEMLAELFDELAVTRVEDGAGRALSGRFTDYPAFFLSLARDRSVPPDTRSTHPRLQILGLLEARLVEADRVVLGGLDETIWPPVAETDAFLNRPMRLKLGLTPPERRIGQTAHDFVQALGTADAIVTRARKRDGKPTVPSRFLERLRAFAGGEIWAALKARGDRYRHLAMTLESAVPEPPLLRPAPQPGPERFPRRLSVTEIETLVRDPYSIFAKHVLRLDPLDGLAVQPSAADRGTILHHVLGTFAADHRGELPADAAGDLLVRGRDAFTAVRDAYPELYALWWPAFVRLVPAFVEWERERRTAGLAIQVERDGVLRMAIGPDCVFELRGRADRIEFGPDGGAAIVDFKSGRVPSDKEVGIGFAPQLTLEAAMLSAGGFKDLPASAGVPALEYVRLGGRKLLEARQVGPPQKDRRSMADIVDNHLVGLRGLVARHAIDGVGYMSRPYAQYAQRYAPYDHLARVKEWSATAGVDDTAEGREP